MSTDEKGLQDNKEKQDRPLMLGSLREVLPVAGQEALRLLRPVVRRVPVAQEKDRSRRCCSFGRRFM